MSSFWGKVIKPGKQPTPLRDEDSQLVMVLKQAALAPDAAKLSTTEPSTLSVSVGGKKETFVLCHLTPGKCEQGAIDLGFDADDEVFFHLTGKCPVHLTGFYEEPDEEDDMEEMEMDDMEEGEDESGEEQEDEADEEDDESDDEPRVSPSHFPSSPRVTHPVSPILMTDPFFCFAGG